MVRTLTSEWWFRPLLPAANNRPPRCQIQWWFLMMWVPVQQELECDHKPFSLSHRITVRWQSLIVTTQAQPPTSEGLSQAVFVPQGRQFSSVHCHSQKWKIRCWISKSEILPNRTKATTNFPLFLLYSLVLYFYKNNFLSIYLCISIKAISNNFGNQ